MNRITAFYRSCNPTEVLLPGDIRRVDCDAGRKGGVAPILAEDFNLADPTMPLHRMFTGHLGVGKSTELQKLRQLLSLQGNADVIYFDISDHLDKRIADLQLADLDALIAERVIDHFKGKDVPLENSYFRDFIDRFRQILLTEITLSKATIAPKISAFESIEFGLGELVAEIKNGPDSSRSILRKAIAETRYSLRKGLDDLLSLARVKLGKNILLIVDGVEKIPSSRHEEIFIDGVPELVDICAHVLFTVPMQLTYHCRFSETRMAFAQDPCTVSMIHPDTKEGMDCLREILATRCTHACELHEDIPPFTLSDVFESDELCDLVCRRSGGHVRQLLMFVQSALTRCKDLPITKEAVDGALRDYRIGMTRQISSHLWPWLRHFREGRLKSMPEGIPDEVRRDVINQLIVFEYINGDSTYDVAPEIRNLAAFNEGEPAKPDSD